MCYNPPEGLMIMSDQHKSIENAIRSVYPNATHGLCYHHLHKNLTQIGKEALIHFKNAAYAYRVEGFGKFFSELELQSHSAHTRLSLIGVERWSRSRSPVPRYSFMTSNVADVLNSRLLWARRFPVSSLLETFRTIVEKWFDERWASAMSRQHELTEAAYNKLTVQVELDHHLRVYETTTHVYKVEEEKRIHQVDLVTRTCECREFDEDKILCRHDVAAIR
ncbi:uncharacterized protein LOC131018877 [Salvia miltiorrhiza]|uniref:uncharacterized protein LOC131018877 n=1 Tax=Salvia miltiorrhiza TaxID=226208 RepID=UPI0025AC06AB|nr:uncharacterized protein LOC131018877 [Salvia miltiorrhiza]